MERRFVHWKKVADKCNRLKIVGNLPWATTFATLDKFYEKSMLSRRQLRVKVLQSLYAFFQSEKTDMAVAERELIRSIEKTHELYFFILLFLTELAHADSLDVEETHRKFFPLEE